MVGWALSFSLKRSIPRLAIGLAIPAMAFSVFGWRSAIRVWMLGALTGIISTLSSSVCTDLLAVVALLIACSGASGCSSPRQSCARFTSRRSTRAS
ncbi:MAG: hypothetical protein HQ453_04780 [Actinobacteria bacterium]|nr:hypothetical protein [Actinomycetota bacterium]